MIHGSYGILGLAVTVLLIGLWTLRRVNRRKNPDGACELNSGISNCSYPDHDIEHRALMFLMTQKTDSVLVALARTIEKERQKLGVDVRNPSMTQAIDAFQAQALQVSHKRPSPYDRILPMADNGIAVAKIARHLQLPEAEVSIVMRLNAA